MRSKLLDLAITTSCLQRPIRCEGAATARACLEAPALCEIPTYSQKKAGHADAGRDSTRESDPFRHSNHQQVTAVPERVVLPCRVFRHSCHQQGSGLVKPLNSSRLGKPLNLSLLWKPLNSSRWRGRRIDGAEGANSTKQKLLCVEAGGIIGVQEGSRRGGGMRLARRRSRRCCCCCRRRRRRQRGRGLFGIISSILNLV